jgi:alcohol dehydrogenase class IV
MVDLASYVWPGPAYFGEGAVEQAGQIISAWNVDRVLLVTDRGVETAGLVEPVLRALERAQVAVAVWDGVEPNPTADVVAAGAARFAYGDIQAMVALGGGSTIDTAKGIQLVATGGGDILEYDVTRGLEARRPRLPLPRLLAIPTTAGTGSEVSAWAVYTDPERRMKVGVGGDWLMPTFALEDPLLTVDLPPFVTACSGFDAFTHAVEAFVSTTDHPPGEALALRAVELVGAHLRDAVADGHSLPARSGMLMASMTAMIALNLKWGGACHALSNAITPLTDIPHGLANAIMLPHQIGFSYVGAPEKYDRVAAALGMPSGSAAAVVAATRQLAADIGLGARLREHGVDRDLLGEMADRAMLSSNHWKNPVPCTRELMLSALEAAW